MKITSKYFVVSIIVAIFVFLLLSNYIDNMRSSRSIELTHQLCSPSSNTTAVRLLIRYGDSSYTIDDSVAVKEFNKACKKGKERAWLGGYYFSYEILLNNHETITGDGNIGDNRITLKYDHQENDNKKVVVINFNKDSYIGKCINNIKNVHN